MEMLVQIDLDITDDRLEKLKHGNSVHIYSNGQHFRLLRNGTLKRKPRNVAGANVKVDEVVRLVMKHLQNGHSTPEATNTVTTRLRRSPIAKTVPCHKCQPVRLFQNKMCLDTHDKYKHPQNG